jgi:glycosyltransferase involved in cell wall biosynthesis
VRNDTFFRSIPLVLKQVPSVVFVCPTMTGEPLAEAWRAEYGLQANVELLGRLDQSEMAQLLRRAQLVVSPSEHDGTPNSLLEAMASGAVPVAGDLESIREWIQDGKNGRLIDPADPNALAEAIIGSLQDDGWRSQASKQNRELVKRRASRPLVFAQARAFYQQVQQSGPML